MSRTLGAWSSSQARATWAGVAPSRSAVATTAGAVNTGFSGWKADPRGKKGTKGTPSLRQASKRSEPEVSARL